jgi:hypothetical protein
VEDLDAVTASAGFDVHGKKQLAACWSDVVLPSLIELGHDYKLIDQPKLGNTTAFDEDSGIRFIVTQKMSAHELDEALRRHHYQPNIYSATSGAQEINLEVEIAASGRRTILMDPLLSIPGSDSLLGEKGSIVWNEWKDYVARLICRCLNPKDFSPSSDGNYFHPAYIINLYNILNAKPGLVCENEVLDPDTVRLIRLLCVVGFAVYGYRGSDIRPELYDVTNANLEALQHHCDSILVTGHDVTKDSCRDFMQTFQGLLEQVFSKQPSSFESDFTGGRLSDGEVQFITACSGYIPGKGQVSPRPDISYLKIEYGDIFELHPSLARRIQHNSVLNKRSDHIEQVRLGF